MNLGWPEAIVAAVTASLTALATIFVGLLVHRREMRKVTADSDKVEAEAEKTHWERFGSEIRRLDERLTQMEAELVKCHEEKYELSVQLLQMRLNVIERGNNRQTAQLVASQIHLERREAERDGQIGATGEIIRSGIPPPD